LKRVRFAFFRIEEKQIRFAFASHFFSKKISLSHSTFRENLDPCIIVFLPVYFLRRFIVLNG
jgi:hypothetical protein